MRAQRVIDLINRLERAEGGSEFEQLEAGSVAGFDALAGLMNDRGEPFTAEAVRLLARSVAAKRGDSLEKVLGWRLSVFAEVAARYAPRPAACA